MLDVFKRLLPSIIFIINLLFWITGNHPFDNHFTVYRENNIESGGDIIIYTYIKWCLHDLML